jgi:putative ATP-binding cassette transporter
MVWVAIVYAIVGTWLTHKIGKPLIPLNFNQQKYEADFRYNLVRFRENCEGVALYRGEEDELRGFRSRFNAVVDNWWAIMKRQKLLTFFTAGYSQAAVIFPFVVGAPRFFSGAIQLGGPGPDLQRVWSSPRRAFLVHRRLYTFRVMESLRGSIDQLP